MQNLREKAARKMKIMKDYINELIDIHINGQLLEVFGKALSFFTFLCYTISSC